MTYPTAHVPMPTITVDDTGTARSSTYGDIYFSARGGMAETEHVFLDGNGLPARWHDRSRFTIGELGFGTGLNFLVAWKKFIETNRAGHLRFVSVEKFPLTVEQLKEALDHWPELAHYAEQLIAHYPLRLPGLHRVHFDRVSLTLGFGDANDLLPDMDANIDAWFLDGFAPAKNGDMWNEIIFENIARLSSGDATFATFTAAGGVKRGLEAVGFTVQKTQGFGSKRDMLVGIRRGESNEKEIPTNITVIGGGIAGCSTARALAERGIKVTLLEKEAIASGASGNDAAVLYPQLTKQYGAATQFHFLGFGFMLHQLHRWNATHTTSGMLKIGKDDEDDAKLRSIRDTLQLDESITRWVERDEASALIGQEIARGGFWFARGTYIHPAELCRTLVAHENISVREQQEVTTLPKGVVVIANGFAANHLLTEKLTMGQSAGQVTDLGEGLELKAVLCHKGYAICLKNKLHIGATYDRHDLSESVTNENHQHNINALAQSLPKWNGKGQILGGRTSIRATTPGRLPYVGRISDSIYVSVGHGSRGMISAPLAAEIIASQICGEPLPVTRSLLHSLRPV